MAENTVLYRVEDRVGIVSLNRPDKLNALTMEMRLAIEAVLGEADQDTQTHVIVLRAEGRSFCVGFDIGGHKTPAPWRHDALKFHERLSTSVRALMTPWRLRKPVIASVQGHALGGGCELTMFCDLTIAADDAAFGEPEVLFSQAGPGFIMPWLIGSKRARELIYFGGTIDAQTALDFGLVNRVVPRHELEATTLKYAKRLSMISPETLVAAKRAINRGMDAAGFNAAIQAGIDVVAPLYATTTEVSKQFDEIRSKEGLKAALRWRRAQLEE